MKESKKNLTIEGPSFIGTKKEFKRYVGPVLRNLVQQIGRKHRAKISQCQHCNSSKDLEAAHVSGRDRNSIIDSILKDYALGSLYHVDLKELEEKFKEEHQHIEETLLILCKSCHRNYDADPAATKSADISSYGNLAPVVETISEPIPTIHKTKGPLFTLAELEEFRHMKIGQVVRSTLPQLLKTNRIGDSELRKLMDPQYSKITFDVNYAVLKKVDERKPLADNRAENGYPRYYAHPVKNTGTRYLITSEWFDRNQEYFIKWLQKYSQ